MRVWSGTNPKLNEVGDAEQFNSIAHHRVQPAHGEGADGRTQANQDTTSEQTMLGK